MLVQTFCQLLVLVAQRTGWVHIEVWGLGLFCLGLGLFLLPLLLVEALRDLIPALGLLLELRDVGLGGLASAALIDEFIQRYL